MNKKLLYCRLRGKLRVLFSVILVFGAEAFAFSSNVYATNVATESKDTSTVGLAGFATGLRAAIPRIIGAVIVIIISFLVAKIAKKSFQKALQKTTGHEAALKFVGKTAYSICLTIGITIALSILGIDISFIVGAVSFGLGFALKDILENYVAGVLILLQEPFKIGDIVKVYEHFGRIEEIQARSTFLRVWDGQRVVIPNSYMISNSLINYSTYPERRISIEVSVSFDTDLDKAMRVIFEAISAHQEVLKEPVPAVMITEFGTSSINFVARFWIDSSVSNWLKMTSDATKMIKQALDREGINIPFPITTLSMNPKDSDDMYKFFEKRI